MESIGSITLNISLDRFQTCSFSTHGCDRSPCHQHQHKHLGNSYQPLGNTWSLQRYVQSDQSMDATWTNKVNIRVQFSAVVVQPSQSCETLSRRQMALNASLYTMKPKASTTKIHKSYNDLSEMAVHTVCLKAFTEDGLLPLMQIYFDLT